MRISDWSSDVCSSDLHCPLPGAHPPGMQRRIAIVGTMPRAIIEAAPHRCVAAKPQFGEHRRRIGAEAIAPRAIGGGLDAEAIADRIAHRAHLRALQIRRQVRSEEHTSELQSLMRTSYAVFCLQKNKKKNNTHNIQS